MQYQSNGDLFIPLPSTFFSSPLSSFESVSFAFKCTSNWAAVRVPFFFCDEKLAFEFENGPLCGTREPQKHKKYIYMEMYTVVVAVVVWGFPDNVI